MNDFVYYVVQFVIAIAVTAITRYLIPWLKTKIDNERLLIIEEWVRNAVSAAEQLITGSLQGSVKKSFVIENIQKLMTEKGIKITPEQLEMLIEAAVNAMNNAKAAETEKLPETIEKLVEGE